MASIRTRRISGISRANGRIMAYHGTMAHIPIPKISEGEDEGDEENENEKGHLSHIERTALEPRDEVCIYVFFSFDVFLRIFLV